MPLTHLDRYRGSIVRSLTRKSCYGSMSLILMPNGSHKLSAELVKIARSRHCKSKSIHSFCRQLLICVRSLKKFINDENWYSSLNRARHLEPHARFVRPKCIHSRQMDITQGTRAGTPGDPQLALYVGTALIEIDSY